MVHHDVDQELECPALCSRSYKGRGLAEYGHVLKMPTVTLIVTLRIKP